MKITRLHLRNYRVYEDELDLELPGGLVGVYGPNGAGKSVLLESILWTLWGRSRTAKEEVRTAGVGGDCIAEVEFEHEGHLYLVRRTITGINHTVKAEAFADNQQIAVGVRDTGRYVHSVLGMNDTAFRASVFAEQKQLAAFSNQTPAERKKLVLQLLGITPLDAARDQARKDAKAARDDIERVRNLLLDVDELRERAVQAAAAVVTAEAELTSEQTALATVRTRLAEADKAFADYDELRHEHDALVAEGKSTRAEHDQAADRVATLAGELAALDEAAARLAALPEIDVDLDELERTLAAVTAVVSAEAALAAIPAPPEVPPVEPVEAEVETLRAAAEAGRAKVAELDGRIHGATEAVARARQAVTRAADLTPGAECPTCGQALGDAFEQVHAHRRGELAETEEALAALHAERDAAASAAASATAALQEASTRLRQLQDAAARAQAVRTRHEAAVTMVETAVEAIGRRPADGEAEALAARVATAKRTLAEAHRLRGQLERRPMAEAAKADEEARLADAAGRLSALRDKVKGLAFEPAKLDRARAARDDARGRAEAALTLVERMRAEVARARAQAEAALERVADAERQHAAMAERAEEARHLGRLADMLNAFRTSVVATVGPRLSAQAADLFGELTDREYDLLQVDPETYEIQIVDQGRPYGMDRFSGSETDLANLALRVAISEHVRFQSGGAVGLLVLDEVFGPLDDDRRQRMLLALERLKARFRQVLVVTHANEIKEELPTAIEVVKLGPRRATARVAGS